MCDMWQLNTYYQLQWVVLCANYLMTCISEILMNQRHLSYFQSFIFFPGRAIFDITGRHVGLY